MVRSSMHKQQAGKPNASNQYPDLSSSTNQSACFSSSSSSSATHACLAAPGVLPQPPHVEAVR
jgi:hypothetical protein